MDCVVTFKTKTTMFDSSEIIAQYIAELFAEVYTDKEWGVAVCKVYVQIMNSV